MPSALANARVLVAVAYAVALAAAVCVVIGLDGWHPLMIAAVADVAATLVVFGFSFYTNNSSIYDPFWSVAPLPIAAYWFASGAAAPGRLRTIIVVLLVAIWGLRLTYNWFRRWKGLADEDWRYVMLRSRHGRRYWLVSLSGIHMMPTALVFAGCLPLFVVFARPTSGFNAVDLAALLFTTTAIWLEARAVRQLAAFLMTRKEGPEFLRSGLWGKCRHPNYLGEVLFWWGLFLFGLAANPTYWWTAIGALSITLLFVYISIPMMDNRMLERRAGYESYQATVPALVPDIFGKKRKRE